MTKNYKIIAELVVSTLGEGTSLSKYIKEIKKEIESYPGIRTLTHPMGTIVEANSLEDILAVTKRAHEKMIDLGCQRIITSLKIDDRRDKERKMEDKVNVLE